MAPRSWRQDTTLTSSPAFWLDTSVIKTSLRSGPLSWCRRLRETPYICITSYLKPGYYTLLLALKNIVELHQAVSCR